MKIVIVTACIVIAVYSCVNRDNDNDRGIKSEDSGEVSHIKESAISDNIRILVDNERLLNRIAIMNRSDKYFYNEGKKKYDNIADREIKHKLRSIINNYKQPDRYEEYNDIASIVAISVDKNIEGTDGMIRKLYNIVNHSYRKGKCIKCIECCPDDKEYLLLSMLERQMVRIKYNDMGIAGTKNHAMSIIDNVRIQCSKGSNKIDRIDTYYLREIKNGVRNEMLEIMNDENENDCVKESIYDAFLGNIENEDYNELAAIIKYEIKYGREKYSSMIYVRLRNPDERGRMCDPEALKIFVPLGMQLKSNESILFFLEYVKCLLIDDQYQAVKQISSNYITNQHSIIKEKVQQLQDMAATTEGRVEKTNGVRKTMMSIDKDAMPRVKENEK